MLKKTGWVLILILGIMTGLWLGKYFAPQPSFGEAQEVSDKERAAIHQELVAAKDPLKTFAKIVKFVSPAVVTISTKKIILHTYSDFFWSFRRVLPQQQQQIGSGVIIDEQGYILTNNHVVAGADEIKVTLADRREFIGRVVGKDRESDLAVVKIKVKGLKPALLGDSDKIEIGDWVLAIGNPFGLEHTVTSGIISARRSRGEGLLTNYPDFIQTDAAINPGNSGGPLVNLQGEVIGINSAIVSRTGGYQGIGLAIPINRVKVIMKKLIEKGKVTRPFLGIEMSGLNQTLAHYYDLPNVAALLKLLKIKEPKGVFVLRTIPRSPAAKAGLLEGDIIIEFNNTLISDPAELARLITQSEVDARVQLKILRNGKEHTLNAQIGERD